MTSAGAVAAFAVHASLVIAFAVRVLLRPHRDPASRIAWIVVLFAVPVLGMLAYVLFGEVNIGRRRVAKMQAVIEGLPALPEPATREASRASSRPITGQHAHLFRVGRSISGFEPVAGNAATLLADSNAAIDAIVTDIDAAENDVHLLFYIWLPDGNGLKIAAALERAAARGVACRALADDLGSRNLIRSEHWRSMRQAGVHVASALAIGNPLLRPLSGRIDLRNHRKIVVIDGRVTYCGSQNCADPEFRIKARFAPWVDIVARFEGPVAAQNQRLFAADWTANAGEDIGHLLSRPPAPADGDIVAQVVGTGPTMRYSAMPELFESAIYAARRELVITTPYYVPSEGMQAALCAAGRRGIDTTIIFPQRNDSWVVAAASRSYYAELLAAGVRIHEFPDGLLHAKTLTIDGEMTLMGSANMDRRSFDLNYENNILALDPGFTREIRGRQESWLARSPAVSEETVARWPVARRLANNAIAMVGPLL